MDITEVETFLMIVSTKSISKTAEILFLSQPTVSNRLKSLENHLNVQLLIRNKGHKTISLTSKGEEFVATAQNFLALWKEAQFLQHSHKSHFLIVGCTDSFGIANLTPLYRQLLAMTPPVDLQIRTHQSGEIYDLLSSYKIDIGFVHHHLPYKNIVSEKVFSEKLFLVQSKNTVLKKERIHTDELVSRNELFFSWDPNYQIWHDRWIGATSRPHIQVDTVYLLDEMWSDHNNWLIAPRSVVDLLSRRKDVFVSEIINAPPNRITYKLTHKMPNHSTQSALKLFESKLHAIISPDKYEDT